MDVIFVSDFVRWTHLLCLALGMGPALYFDLRSFRRMSKPLTAGDAQELSRIHRVISVACVGLWATGLVMIWDRTGFELAAFSPKLWGKVIVVTILTLNSIVLSLWAIPKLGGYIGFRMADLLMRHHVPMTLCAGLSLACWLLALALGSSKSLKTASWDVISTVLIGGGSLCICGVLFVSLAARMAIRRGTPEVTI